MNDDSKKLNRRDFLKSSALTGGLIIAGPLLGCASARIPRDPSATAAMPDLAFATFYGGYYGADGTPYPCEYGPSYYQDAYYGYAYVGDQYLYGRFEGQYACPDASAAAPRRKPKRRRSHRR